MRRLAAAKSALNVDGAAVDGLLRLCKRTWPFANQSGRLMAGMPPVLRERPDRPRPPPLLLLLLLPPLPAAGASASLKMSDVCASGGDSPGGVGIVGTVGSGGTEDAAGPETVPFGEEEEEEGEEEEEEEDEEEDDHDDEDDEAAGDASWPALPSLSEAPPLLEAAFSDVGPSSRAALDSSGRAGRTGELRKLRTAPRVGRGRTVARRNWLGAAATECRARARAPTLCIRNAKWCMSVALRSARGRCAAVAVPWAFCVVARLRGGSVWWILFLSPKGLRQKTGGSGM